MLQYASGGTHGKASDTALYTTIRAQLHEKDHSQHVLIFIISPEHIDNFRALGIPNDLKYYYMTYRTLLDKKRKMDAK